MNQTMLTVMMIFAGTMQLIAFGAVVMCALYLRRISAALAVRDRTS